MLRHVVKPLLLLPRRQIMRMSTTSSTRRSFAAAATSREKRALNEQQLQGETKAAAAAAAAVVPPPPTAPPTNGGSGGSSNLPIVLAIVAAGGAAAAAAAYSMDMIPGLLFEQEPSAAPAKTKEENTAPVPKEEGAKKEETAAVVSKENVVAPDGDEPATPTTTAQVVETTSAPETTGNRVLNIVLPEGSKRSEQPPTLSSSSATDHHPFGGNKVSMSPTTTSTTTTVAAESSENAPTVDAALQELKAQLSRETSRALSEAHQELAKLSSLDMSELDNMTPSQLKIRLVQMTKDMEERTKWEAVRLKEFLAMKEKEVQDKYMLVMKKQRLEAEHLMEQRLREQSDTLTREAQAALSEKEQALQGITENSLKIQEQAYNDEKAAFEKRVEEAMSAKYEELFGKSMAQAKENFAKKMEQKAAQMESLTKKLTDLEFALQSSKDFKSGSVQAHRMSAAALALADALESSTPAGAAMAALKAVAEDNAVVSSTLEAIPSTVATKGVMTLQELQTHYEEKVYPKCRRAAMVPAGQQGVEGQLLGSVFATLKYPPSPDDPAPEADKDESEYVLARARRHVQLGELEQAAEQMGKLKGQPAFTASDWMQRVKERVAVDKALKVIRMECVLANESMTSHPGGN